MDNINFDNNGGMLLFQQALKFMQSSYSTAIAALASAIGVNVIINGCVRNGSMIGAGVMIINGEVMSFAGGQYADYIAVQETDTAKQYDNGQTQQMYAQRVAVTTNVADGNVAFVNFITIKQLAAFAKLPTQTSNAYDAANDNALATQTGLFNLFQATKSQVPTGVIVMWSGAIAAIPVGWKLCDGSGGTPNLRDRFVVGAGSSYGIGQTGGNTFVFLNQGQLPPLSFQLPISRNGNGGGGSAWAYMDPGHGANDTITTNTIGQGAGIDIRPLYYALAFIMKV